MKKHRLLLFAFFTIAAILITDKRVLANENIKNLEKKSEGKDWIEEIKEEIRALDQGSDVKDEIKAEEPSKT